MTSQKPPKKARELTNEEAIERLFHPKVVEHAKRHVKEADERSDKPAKKKSTRED